LTLPHNKAVVWRNLGISNIFSKLDGSIVLGFCYCDLCW